MIWVCSPADTAAPCVRAQILNQLRRRQSPLQVCRSDTDVKSALQAWCAYGQPGTAPPDLFKQANPLQRAFASSRGTAASTAASSASDQVQPEQVSKLSGIFTMMCSALCCVLVRACAEHRAVGKHALWQKDITALAGIIPAFGIWV